MILKCQCGWEGEIWECKPIPVDSGDEGVDFEPGCPYCGSIVLDYDEVKNVGRTRETKGNDTGSL